MTQSLRRLPVYLLLDCSESMAGAAFDAVREGLQYLMDDLRGDPVAVESVWLSVITFSGVARVVAPLRDLSEWKSPRLVLGSGTSLGVALELLERRMVAEVTPQTAATKGDWKPIVFLMTDGNPTDTWFSIADRFLENVTGRKANVIAVACGPAVNIGNLQRITPTVLAMRVAEPPAFREFFRWISQSIRITSAQFSSAATEAATSLPPLPPTMEMAAEGLQLPDNQNVFLLGRCHERKALYLMRYEAMPRALVEELRGERGVALPLDRTLYAGTVSYPLEEFDAVDSAQLGVASDSLLLPPACPHCGNLYWALCSACQRLFCIGSAGKKTCPWCTAQSDYATSETPFDVERGLG